MAIIKCSTCGQMTSDRGRCCDNCGNEIKKTARKVFCPACGLAINDATIQCPGCNSIICPKCKSLYVRLQNPQVANFASGTAIAGGNAVGGLAGALVGAAVYTAINKENGLEKTFACLNCGHKFD